MKRKTNWKKQAWTHFSRYIRLRDCLRTTGTKERCVCVTCGKTVPYGKELHAGHCVPGRGNSILLHEGAVWGQCAVCNIWKSGNHGQFALYVTDKLGRKYYDDLVILAKQPCPKKNWEWEEEAKKWKEKADMIETGRYHSQIELSNS